MREYLSEDEMPGYVEPCEECEDEAGGCRYCCEDDDPSDARIELYRTRGY